VFDSDMPLKQVAAETGFKSVQHMTTVFRVGLGKTPASYRKAASMKRFQRTDFT
jgi:LacI family transcriptional regulator, galactose operon repressor